MGDEIGQGLHLYWLPRDLARLRDVCVYWPDFDLRQQGRHSVAVVPGSVPASLGDSYFVPVGEGLEGDPRGGGLRGVLRGSDSNLVERTG